MNFAQKAGLLISAGAAQFVIAVIIGDRGGAAPRVRDPINTGYLSDLGAEPYRAIFNASVILVGFAFFGTAYYIRKAFPGQAALLASRLGRVRACHRGRLL